MAGAKSVFISHADKDKPRIKFILDSLIAAGFRLFIDHPEKIDGLDLAFIDSLHKIGERPEDGWDKQLDKAIAECDCVFGILSSSVELKNRTLLSEIERGHAMKKLVLCQIDIERPDVLSGFTRTVDSPSLQDAISGERRDKTLRFLADKITSVIAANREARRESVSDRIVSGGSGISEKFREIRHILPLCVGRDDQRRAIRKAARRSAETGEIVPVVVIGPRNELPKEVAESLLFENMSGEASLPNTGFVVKSIALPSAVSARFKDSYFESLGKVVCNDDCAVQSGIMQVLAGIGHNVVLASSLIVSGQGAEVGMVELWAKFWKDWNKASPTRQNIVPVLNVVFGPAKVGWDTVDPKVPPGRSEDASAHKRNAILVERLGPIVPKRGPEGDRFEVNPFQFATPIRLQQFGDWADSIDDSIVDGASRMALTSFIESGHFESPDALRDGVSHESLYASVVKWFDDNSATRG